MKTFLLVCVYVGESCWRSKLDRRQWVRAYLSMGTTRIKYMLQFYYDPNRQKARISRRNTKLVNSSK